MNFLLTLAFKGTQYHGFQVQENALSVCEVVQNAMQAVLGHRPPVKGSSRTDAGVHARGFALSMKAETAIPVKKLPLALNDHLPQDVRVRAARVVPEGFHARYSACGKEYSYRFLNAQTGDPLWQGLYYRVGGHLDENAMQAAADVLCGQHDFSAFCSAGAKAGDRVRHVQRLTVVRQGEWLVMRVAADGFLYNMVRIMGGTLLLAGRGELNAANVAEILQSQNRQNAGPTLAAEGLCLEEVFYPPAAFLENGGADAGESTKEALT